MVAELGDDVHPDSVSLTHGWRNVNVSWLTTGDDVDALTAMVVQTACAVGICRRSAAQRSGKMDA